MNFTVGPVQSPIEVCEIGGEQVPYFRTEEFSSLILSSEKLLLKMAYAPINSRSIFLTGSGTAAMESSVINIFDKDDKLIIVNGGSFGQRFCEICDTHNIEYSEITVPFGSNISHEMLYPFDKKGYTGLLLNLDETSSGVKYDLKLVSEFCKGNNLILVVDAISSFLADSINMEENHIDVLIIGSQKALACHPGISILILSSRAITRVHTHISPCYYLDLKKALSNAERGQTPFTPAVGIIRQIHTRLSMIDKNGGVETEIKKCWDLANYFREQIQDLPLLRVTSDSSNAVTALYSPNYSAKKLFIKLKEKYDLWICPNGGEYADTVFRVGHIGNLTKLDYDYLIDALRCELRQKYD